MADIFISYTSSDSDWAKWIALELEKLGHTAHVHEWEVQNGDDIYGWMQSRHDAADRILCVVSDEYFKAPYSTLERNAALWQAAAKRPGFVLLVAVKPCKFPTLSDHLSRCELFGVPEDAARLRLRQFMEAPHRPEAILYPGRAFAVSNIPVRMPEHFLGRDDAMAAIHAALNRGDGRVAIAALYGLPGVGKTTLAAAYADRHKADYRATWWIKAQTQDGMRADLISLGARLGWVAADDKEEEETKLEVVRDRLRDEGEGLLLIYDNATDAEGLRPYLPLAGAAHLIVTSTAQDWRKIAALVEINIWRWPVGANYLIARTGRDRERPDAEALSETLGGLPLAHEQAAAYCEKLGVSFAEYSNRFQKTPVRLLDADRYATPEYHGGLTVAKAFSLAIDEATRICPAAESLVVYAALLAPEPIPLFLFCEPREKFGEPLASQLVAEELDEAVGALRAFALVERETITDAYNPAMTTGAISLHRLVRIVAAGRWEAEAVRAASHILVEAMAAVYPDTISEPNAWPRARWLDALAVHLVDHLDMPTAAEEAATQLLILLGNYRLLGLRAFKNARRFYERALKGSEKTFGPQHPLTAKSLDSLARLFQSQGDWDRAQPLLERALAIRERSLGPDHPDTATSLDSLANLFHAQDDWARAQPLLERALAIRERSLGPDHPDTATSLDLLASLFRAQDDWARAQPLLERALAIRERSLGPDHPLIAMGLFILADLIKTQGDPAGAQPLFDRALAISERPLDPKDPWAAMALFALGALRQAKGDLSGARLFLERALAINERTWGPEQSETRMILVALANLLQVQGDLSGARTLFERALTLNERTLGLEHPFTTLNLISLAQLLQVQGDLVGAQSLLERALATTEKTQGPEHPLIGMVLLSLAHVLKAQGDPIGAQPLFERATPILEQLSHLTFSELKGFGFNPYVPYVDQSEQSVAAPRNSKAGRPI